MQDGWKAVWSIPYISVVFFPSLKQSIIAYRSSKVSSCPDCIFEINQLLELGFSRVYSNCCCSCWFEPEIIKIGQSSYEMYSNTEFLRVYDNFKCLYKKCQETYCMHHVYAYIYMWPWAWQLLEYIIIYISFQNKLTVSIITLSYFQNICQENSDTDILTHH